MKYKLTGFIACTTILLGACAAPGPPSAELSIEPFAEELWRQHLNNLTLTEDLSITEVYGDKWKEYAIFCGYMGGASIAEDLGITKHPFPKNGSIPEGSTYLYLSDKAGAQEWIDARGGGVYFCSGDDLGIASLAPASKPQYFQLTDSGGWERIKSPSQSSTAPTTAAETPHHQN